MNYQALVIGINRTLFVHAMSFGDWLREKINERQLSNAALARRAGVSPTYIGNLVRDYSQNTKSGKVRPSEEVVERIAKALGVDVDVDAARLAAGYASQSESRARSIELPDGLNSVRNVLNVQATAKKTPVHTAFM